jgi:NitT/TauT family transport system substrate-binding protein
VRTRPDFVRRFVRASLDGWQSYLFGDPSPGNAFIKRNNPDMPEAQMLYAIKVIRERGMVDSGDAKRLGIGAMTDERWAKFYRSIVGYGLLPPGLDVKQAYTLQFLPTPTGP